MSALLEAALRYAELGYPLFPCARALQPVPLTPHGFKNATTDPAQIERWWTEHPEACLGLATAGLLVVDIDGPDNPWLTDAPEQALDLAVGPLSLTPGGGRHHLFRRPPGKAWTCTVGRLAPRVDIRTDGGYIVLPPSQRPDGDYRWLEGCELDRPADQLPEPPPWLTEQLDFLVSSSTPGVCRATGPDESNRIPSGQRNATLARLAGTMRRVGMSPSEINAALLQVNADRCQPPLPAPEVNRIVTSITRYEPDQIAVALAEGHADQLAQLEFASLTSRELASGKFDLEYLIDGLLVRGQPGILAGPKKTLKTNLSIDLALSLALGEPFLQRFPVASPTRVGLMSGESGAATIQETARRIAASKNVPLEECANAFWCFQVPQLGDALHTDALRRFIDRHQLEVLILDPTYLMMLNLGDDAGNLFVVGKLLKSLGDLAQATNCTPLLCHHLKKSLAEPYEPAELENIAWAGFQEFVRQWLLLNRRVRYDPDRGGHHELWLSVGGSAGHSGLWGLNIDEGTRQDAGGRHWDVTVVSARDAYDERVEGEDQVTSTRKQRLQEVRLGRQKEAVLKALQLRPEGDTTRVIRELAGIAASAIQTILDDLVEEGSVTRCTVLKNKRNEPAYRLANAGAPGALRCSRDPSAAGVGGGAPAYI